MRPTAAPTAALTAAPTAALTLTLILAVTLAVPAAPARAETPPAAAVETPLTGQAFEALTEGRTMTWAEFGQVYGVEQYLPGRGVRWTVLGGDCLAGHWYAEGPAICFRYEDRPDPVCWVITAQGDRLLARLVGTPSDRAPVEIVETSEPMACTGPEVGV